MPAEPSVAALLHAQATPSQRRYLACCAAVAERSETPMYLVGGAVRDLLMTGGFLDIDVTVEGSASEVATDLAADLDGTARKHDRFLTAEVLLEGDHIDIVTARKERYPEPAGLPLVSPGTLEDDLERRDFAINAMAVRLWPPGEQELIDPFDGRLDIDKRQLRVLHDRSFFDDPTRILRGLRLAARLDLRLDEMTENLAKAAVDAGAFGPLTSSRLRHELILLLEDREVETSLRQLDSLGFMQVLGRTGAVTQSDWLALERVVDLRPRRDSGVSWPTTAKWWLVYLMSLFLTASDTERRGLSDRLDLDPVLSDALANYPENVQTTRTQLEDPSVSAHQVCSVLDRLHPEEVILLFATSERVVQTWVERWRGELGRVHLQISGKDLKRAGFEESPAVGWALESTLNARRDGLIQPEDELDFAVKQLREDNN